MQQKQMDLISLRGPAGSNPHDSQQKDAGPALESLPSHIPTRTRDN